MSDRFASRFEKDIAHLLQDKDSKSTYTSTKLVINVLKQFVQQKDVLSKNKAWKSPSKIDCQSQLPVNYLEFDPNYITKHLFTGTSETPRACCCYSHKTGCFPRYH